MPFKYSNVMSKKFIIRLTSIIIPLSFVQNNEKTNEAREAHNKIQNRKESGK